MVLLRLVDDSPEQIQHTYKQANSECLPYSIWQVLFGIVGLAAGLRGLVWVDIRSKSAVVWRGTHEERGG